MRTKDERRVNGQALHRFPDAVAKSEAYKIATDWGYLCYPDTMSEPGADEVRFPQLWFGPLWSRVLEYPMTVTHDHHPVKGRGSPDATKFEVIAMN